MKVLNIFVILIRFKFLKLLGDAFTMPAQLTSLVGYQRYAVYASITSTLNTIGLFSPIAYFVTLQRQPEPILNLRGHSLSRSAIELVWQPPLKPNGPLTTYLVYYASMKDRLPVNSSKLLCLMKSKLKKKIKESIHDETINNLLFFVRSLAIGSNCSS